MKHDENNHHDIRITDCKIVVPTFGLNRKRLFVMNIGQSRSLNRVVV